MINHQEWKNLIQEIINKMQKINDIQVLSGEGILATILDMGLEKKVVIGTASLLRKKGFWRSAWNG